MVSLEPRRGDHVLADTASHLVDDLPRVVLSRRRLFALTELSGQRDFGRKVEQVAGRLGEPAAVRFGKPSLALASVRAKYEDGPLPASNAAPRRTK